MQFIDNEDDLIMLDAQVKARFWSVKSIVTKEQYESVEFRLEE